MTLSECDRVELETLRRMVRVDSALARQLSRSIGRNARLRTRIEDWLRAYPVDLFPEPDFKTAAELLSAGGLTLDAISASNSRHVLRRLLEFMQGDSDDE